jgi:ornithine decarboxylase antizyme 1
VGKINGLSVRSRRGSILDDSSSSSSSGSSSGSSSCDEYDDDDDIQELIQNLPEGEPIRIIVRYYLTNSTILTWETTYVNNTLYIEVPHGCLPDASKDAFVALLEYAEEVLLCNNAIVYFSKEREDRATLIRTFMFMGFFVAPPNSPIIDVPDTNNVYLVYKIN